VDWDIQVGETLQRTELHDRWGGGRYGGMEPSVKANSVFLFTNPSKGEAFGYRYDGWHADGTFRYTGDGQVGDQSPSEGGNKALLDAADRGRTIRLFRSQGRDTTYLGEFTLADDPYDIAEAPDREGLLRSVLVFRLTPTEHVQVDEADNVEPDLAAPQELPLEADNIDGYAQQRPSEPLMAVRREAKLVGRYATWLKGQGQESVRHKVPIPGGGYLFTDVYNKTTGELLEAKASGARQYVRTGLGQLLDYARFVHHQSKGLLLPSRPSDDLLELLNGHGCAVVWEEGSTFHRSDPEEVSETIA